jgi:apolipoprotein N-acyltransferase
MASAELIDVPARAAVPRHRVVAPVEENGAASEARDWPRTVARFCLRCVAVMTLAACLAWPWLNQQHFWVGWLGLGGFLYFRRYELQRTAPFWTLFYSMAALVIAFHWTPAAMAYTMNASLALGTAVALPLLLVEAARLAVPFLLVSGAATRSFLPGWLPRWLLLAIFAVALETLVPTVFPWRLGYLQADAPVLNQMVPLLGPAIATVSVLAMAALVCSAAAVARQRWRRTSPSAGLPQRERKEFWTAAVFAGANLLWGAWSFHTWNVPTAEVETQKLALVQVDPSYMESLDKMRDLTRQVERDVDLVCWPESSIGCYSVSVTDFIDRKHLLKNSRMPLRGKVPMKAAKCEILAGGKSFTGPADGDGPERVSAFLIDTQQRIVDRYDKTRLMPFGEYVPGAQTIPALATLFGFGDDPPLPGAEPRALTTSCGARVGVMMCYEDMLPDVSRALVRDGAEVLIALINGTAFENPVALRQHRQLACFRALENRRYLVRTASTGSTCIIDPLGRRIAELPVQTEGMLQAKVALLRGTTLYSRTGDVFGWTCVVASGCFLIYQAAGRSRGRRRPQDTSVGGK